MKERKFVGFDIETSGLDSETHRVIQVGAVAPDGTTYRSDVGWANCACDPQALKINGFTTERIGAALPAADVDTAFAAWLANVDNGGLCIAVGWNVGSFDLTFIRKQLPRAWERFSYQAMDLNSACFTLARAHGVQFSDLKARVGLLCWRYFCLITRSWGEGA